MARKKLSVKDKITNAVISLLGIRSISEMKINELTEVAKVARASFYRNFNTFDEVLDYIAVRYCDSIYDRYMTLLKSNDYNDWYDQTKKILTSIYEKKKTFNDTLTANLKLLAHKAEKKYICKINKEWSDKYQKYRQISLISSFYAVCMTWVESGAQESIEEMTQFILKYVARVEKVA